MTSSTKTDYQYHLWVEKPLVLQTERWSSKTWVDGKNVQLHSLRKRKTTCEEDCCYLVQDL
jgi:hypothetical protein